MKIVNCRIKNPNVRIFKDIAEIPDSWDKLLPYKHFLKTSTLQLTTQAELPDVEHLFAGFFENEELIGVAYFQLLNIRKYHLKTEQLSLVSNAAWKLISTLMCPKLLVAGHLFHHEISTFYTKIKTPYEAYVVYSSMMDQCLTYSGVKALLVKDLAPEMTTYFHNLRPQFMRMPNDISMEMHIEPEWQTMKDYEKSLKHKYAQRFRKVRSQLKGVEIRELNADELDEHKHRIFALYNQVAYKQDVRLGYLSAEYLPMLKKAFEKSFKVWAFYKNEELIAFYTAWHHNGTFDMYYIGFDYESNKEHNLYFNMLFFGVEQAIAHHCKLLIMGRTALEAKARLGCEPKYLSTFIYIKNKWIRQWVNNVSPRSEGEEWENRHPFIDKVPVAVAVKDNFDDVRS